MDEGTQRCPTPSHARGFGIGKKNCAWHHCAPPGTDTPALNLQVHSSKVRCAGAGSPQAPWWVHGPPGEVSGCRSCITESRWGHSHPAEGALQEGLYNDEAPGQDQRMRTSHMEAEGG